MGTLAEAAETVLTKVKRGELTLTVGEWQVIIEALEMVSGATETVRQEDLSALYERIKK